MKCTYDKISFIFFDHIEVCLLTALTRGERQGKGCPCGESLCPTSCRKQKGTWRSKGTRQPETPFRAPARCSHTSATGPPAASAGSPWRSSPRRALPWLGGRRQQRSGSARGGPSPSSPPAARGDRAPSEPALGAGRALCGTGAGPSPSCASSGDAGTDRVGTHRLCVSLCLKPTEVAELLVWVRD